MFSFNFDQIAAAALEELSSSVLLINIQPCDYTIENFRDCGLLLRHCKLINAKVQPHNDKKYS